MCLISICPLIAGCCSDSNGEDREGGFIRVHFVCFVWCRGGLRLGMRYGYEVRVDCRERCVWRLDCQIGDWASDDMKFRWLGETTGETRDVGSWNINRRLSSLFVRFKPREQPDSHMSQPKL